MSQQTVDEGVQLTVSPAASDVESPPQVLTYQLLSAPTGASVNAGSGVITWTPAEDQAPGSYTFTLRVYDNGTPSLSATQSFLVTAREVNTTPVLGSINNQTINEGAPSTSRPLQPTATSRPIP